MTLPRNKRERIKQRLANREPWAAIKKEEHVCFDTISRIRKEPLSPPRIERYRLVTPHKSNKDL